MRVNNYLLALCLNQFSLTMCCNTAYLVDILTFCLSQHQFVINSAPSSYQGSLKPSLLLEQKEMSVKCAHLAVPWYRSQWLELWTGPTFPPHGVDSARCCHIRSPVVLQPCVCLASKQQWANAGAGQPGPAIEEHQGGVTALLRSAGILPAGGWSQCIPQKRLPIGSQWSRAGAG